MVEFSNNCLNTFRMKYTYHFSYGQKRLYVKMAQRKLSKIDELLKLEIVKFERSSFDLVAISNLQFLVFYYTMAK